MLGVYWDTALDVFVSKVNLKKKQDTRRGFLSDLSPISDAIGYLQPYIVPVKKLMQKLCTLGIGKKPSEWDFSTKLQKAVVKVMFQALLKKVRQV